MPDLKPFVQQDNVIRLSPLTKVVAGNAASAGSQGGAASAGSYNTDAGASYPKGGSTGNPQLDALADAARSGDGNAMSMLEALGWTLGVGGALVAGGAATYNALKKGKSAAQMDPASVKSAGELPTQARLPKPQEQKLLPAPTKAITDATGGRYDMSGSGKQLALPAPQKSLPDMYTERYNMPAPTEQKLLPDLNANARAALEDAYKRGAIDLQKKKDIEAAYAQKALQDGEEAARLELEKQLAGAGNGIKLKAARAAAKRLRIK